MATLKGVGCPGIPIGIDYTPPTHPAVDYDVAQGTPVYALMPGSVATFKWNVSYGYHVILYSGLWRFLYGHLSVISVPNHQGVKQGALLGLTGCTGHCTGPHLHFEVSYLGISVDPHTLPCPLHAGASVPGAYVPLIGKTTADPLNTIPLAYTLAPQSFTKDGLLRKYAIACERPHGGGFLSKVPIVGQAAGLVKDTSYAICLVTDVNTYIRLAMIVFGAILLTRGALDFSKILSPALGAKLEAGHAMVKTAAKAAVVA